MLKAGVPEIVISFPESLNGDTGLVYSYLGEPHEFERMTVKAILNRGDVAEDNPY